MPKVSDAYRDARRDEIARATLRVLERRGVRDTSIADIVEESGLSTGAIYSHFSNKAELARYIVGRFLIVRIDGLRDGGVRGEVQAPRAVLAEMLRVFAEDGLPAALVVQFWGEAMVDEGLHDEMARTAAHLSESLSIAVRPWASGVADPSDVDRLAADTARTIATLAQGYIANVAVFGPRSVDAYVESVTAALRD